MALTKISTAMISQSAAAVDLNVDAGTFYVDTTNNRVGVGGKTDPDTPLHVVGTVTATLFAGSGASLTNIPNSALTNSSITINSTATSLGGSITLTTANIAENTNLYYTNARADARIAAADTDNLSEGSSNLYYTDARVDARISGGSLGNITTTGYIRGPSSFTIDPAAHGDNSGTVVIAGNLQVDGTTTTINSTTMTVDDKNITLASGSANAGAASGAGFTVDIGSGTNPTITYNGTNDEWDFNKSITIPEKIVHAGDTDTFFRFAGANDIRIVAGNVEHAAFDVNTIVFNQSGANMDFRVESTGNASMLHVDAGNDRVGIGTNSPAQRLDVREEKTGGGVLIQVYNTDNANTTTQTAGIAIGPDSRGATTKITAVKENADFSTNAGRDIALTFSSVLNNTPTEAMRIQSSGNVGIGNTNPGELLSLYKSVGTTLVQAAVHANSTVGFEIKKTNATTQTWRIVDGQTVNGVLEFYDATNSATRMAIKGNGYVGIGTTNPLGKFVVSNGGAEGFEVFPGSASGQNSFQHYNRSGSAYLRNRNIASEFTFNLSGATDDAVTFKAGGNVGIGDTTPDWKFTVEGSASDNWISRIYNTATDGAGLLVRTDATAANDKLAFAVYSDSGYKMSVKSTGNVGIGTTAPSPDYGSDTVLEIKGSTAPGLVINDTGQGSKYGIHADSNDLKINYGSNTLITFQNDGNVGIGNTNPAAYGKFLVQGTGNLLNLNATSGVAYQAFYENGTGRFYFGTLNGSDGLAFIDADGSTERMRIDSTGAVIVNNSGGDAQIYLGGSSGTSRMYLARSSTDALLWNVDGGAMRFGTNNAERMRIDSGGRLGLSNTSAVNYTGSGSNTFVLGNSSSTTGSHGMTIVAGNQATSSIAFSDHAGDGGTTDYRGLFQYVHADDSLRIFTASTEAMRITSAGDMYFGQTSGSAADVGHIMQDNGALYNTAYQTTVQYLRRLNTDGAIAQFNKDSIVVGTIGVGSTRLTIGSNGASGLRFDSANVMPMRSGALSDAAVDIGYSTNRFKDLHLSGGIRLSGSDMLNYYEKGSWTPKIAHNDGSGEISLTVSAATYVRIGSLCYVQGYLTAINPNGNQGTSSLYYGIRNWPFTPQNYGVWNLAYASSNMTTYGGYSSSASFYFLLPTGSAPVGQGHVSGTTFNGYGSNLTLMFNATYYVYGT